MKATTLRDITETRLKEEEFTKTYNSLFNAARDRKFSRDIILPADPAFQKRLIEKLEKLKYTVTKVKNEFKNVINVSWSPKKNQKVSNRPAFKEAEVLRKGKNALLIDKRYMLERDQKENIISAEDTQENQKVRLGSHITTWGGHGAITSIEVINGEVVVFFGGKRVGNWPPATRILLRNIRTVDKY